MQMRGVVGAMGEAFEARLHDCVADERETGEQEPRQDHEARPGAAGRKQRRAREGGGQEQMDDPRPPKGCVGQDGGDRAGIGRGGPVVFK